MAGMVGARVSLGWGAESTPGTAVTPTEYIPVETDQITLAYDPARKPVELGVGTLVIDQYITENDATVKGNIGYPLFATLGQGLIAAAGLTSGGITSPQSITVTVNRGTDAEVWAGLLPNNVKISHSSKGEAKVMIGFDGLAKPAQGTAGTPSYAADAPYVWGHIQPFVLIGGGSTPQTHVDDLEVDVKMANVTFYGANSSLPTDIIPGPITCTGKFTRLFTDWTEYTSFLSVGQTPGLVQFQWARPGHGVTIAMPNAFYSKADRKQPIKGAIVEDIEFGTTGLGGGQLLTYTAA